MYINYGGYEWYLGSIAHNGNYNYIMNKALQRDDQEILFDRFDKPHSRGIVRLSSERIFTTLLYKVRMETTLPLELIPPMKH